MPACNTQEHLPQEFREKLLKRRKGIVRKKNKTKATKNPEKPKRAKHSRTRGRAPGRQLSRKLDRSSDQELGPCVASCVASCVAPCVASSALCCWEAWAGSLSHRCAGERTLLTPTHTRPFKETGWPGPLRPPALTQILLSAPSEWPLQPGWHTARTATGERRSRPRSPPQHRSSGRQTRITKQTGDRNRNTRTAHTDSVGTRSPAPPPRGRTRRGSTATFTSENRESRDPKRTSSSNVSPGQAVHSTNVPQCKQRPGTATAAEVPGKEGRASPATCTAAGHGAPGSRRGRGHTPAILSPTHLSAHQRDVSQSCSTRGPCDAEKGRHWK